MTILPLIGIFYASPAIGQLDAGPPRPVNSFGNTDASADFLPSIATDGAGTWITVWYSNIDLVGNELDNDIFVSVSNDNGASWSAAQLLHSSFANDTGEDLRPVIAADTTGTWIVAWESNEDNSGAFGLDFDILVSRSTDGATWSAPALLNSKGMGGGGNDFQPALKTDNAGTWVAVWQSREIAGDADVSVARSTDDGVTWQTQELLNTNGDSDVGDDSAPTVATDGSGTWVAAWESNENLNGEADGDVDLFVARSTDNAASWSAPTLLNTNGMADVGQDFSPMVAADPTTGTWVAVWRSFEDLNGVAGTDEDIFIARSSDAGATWSAPELLNTNGTTDIGGDGTPAVLTDNAGTLVAAWLSSENLNGVAGGDNDVFVAISTDEGLRWSPPALLNTNGTTDIGNDGIPVLATDAAGAWIAVWDSFENLNETAGPDSDIFAVPFEVPVRVNAALSGRVTTPTDNPVTCAAVEATLQGGATVRAAVTDLNGEYFFADLPAGIYDLRILAPDFGERDAGSVDLTGGPVSGRDFQLMAENLGRTVSGLLVDDATAEPLVGVFVEALQGNQVIASTYSCASGEYLLVIPQTKGVITITLRFSLPNYITEERTNVEVPEDGAEINESLAKAIAFPASLAGVVSIDNTDPAKPIADARITLRGPANISATTGADGTYIFPAILDGAYTMSASADGFQSQAITKILAPSGVAAQSFALTPDIPTDINGDNQVNAVDVQLVINGALGLELPEGAQPDVNFDNSINAVDVQLVINAALGLL